MKPLTLVAIALFLEGCAVPALRDTEDLNAQLTYLPWNCIDSQRAGDNSTPCYFNDVNDWPVNLSLQAPEGDPPFALRVSGLFRTIGPDGTPLDLPSSWLWPVPRTTATNLDVSESDLYAMHMLVVSGRLGSDGCLAEEHCKEYEERIKDATDRNALLQSVAGTLRLVIHRPQTEPASCRQQCILKDPLARSASCEIDGKTCPEKPDPEAHVHPYSPYYAVRGLCSPPHDRPATNDTPKSLFRAVEFELPAANRSVAVRVLAQPNAYFIGPAPDKVAVAAPVPGSTPTQAPTRVPGTVTSLLLEADLPVFFGTDSEATWEPMCSTVASLQSRLQQSDPSAVIRSIDRSCRHMANPGNTPGSPVYLPTLYSSRARDPSSPGKPLDNNVYAKLYASRCIAKGGTRTVRLGIPDSKGRLPSNTDIDIGGATLSEQELAGLLLAPGDHVLTESH